MGRPRDNLLQLNLAKIFDLRNLMLPVLVKEIVAIDVVVPLECPFLKLVIVALRSCN